MKTVLLSILLYTIALPAFCQTPQNSVETDIAVIKTDIAVLKTDVAMMKTDITVLKTDVAVLKTDIQNLNGKIDSLETHFGKRFESFETRFESLEKHFDRQNNIIIACIGIPIAILAIGATVWGILAYRRSRKEDALEKQVETLTQEIEVLKRRQIVNP